MESAKLVIDQLGPIRHAELQLGDLTVFTGPQASGKSVALQTLKLLIDQDAIVRTMSDHGLIWREQAAFLDLFYGEGMHAIWSMDSQVSWQGRDWSPRSLRSPRSSAVRNAVEHVSYIPAQRVMSLREGWTRPFSEYRSGDPFVLREFSQRVHEIVQREMPSSDLLFPKEQRFNDALRSVVSEHVLGGFELHVDTETLQKRFVLKDPRLADKAPALPFLTWSAGQREFVPLLLGLYRLMPAGASTRRGSLEWAIIEEPEMGLHPRAIAATMAFILELMRRGYRVLLSTHSTQVLDVVWGLRRLQDYGASPTDAAHMIHLGTGRTARRIGESALSAKLKVYFFEREKEVLDISGLDPASERDEESGWGGIAGFSEDVASRVANAAYRHIHAESVK